MSGSAGGQPGAVADALAELLPRLGGLLRGRGAHLVGGYVRDRLLGRVPREVDLVVSGDGLAAARQLADALGGAFHPLDAERGVGRVVLSMPQGRLAVDVASLQGRDLEEDLRRRDFTVNAMAIPLGPQGEGGRLIDPLGGREDLKARVLSLPAPDALVRDPVRLLRAVRLEAELGFHLDMRAEAAIRERTQLVRLASAERLREELGRIFSLPESLPAARRLRELSLAEALFPRALPRPEHALQVLGGLETLTGDAARPSVLDELLSGGLGRWALLRLAALLHHAPRLQAGLLELRFSRAEARAAARPVAALPLVDQAVAEGLDRLRIFRLLERLGPEAPSAFLLWGAHQLAERGEGHWRQALAGLLSSWEDPSYRPAPLVRGQELIRALGLQPGPLVGRLLGAIREAQVEGRVSHPQEAVELAREILSAGPADDPGRDPPP